MLYVLYVLYVPIFKNNFGTIKISGKSEVINRQRERLFHSPLTPMIRYVRSVPFYYRENRTIKQLFGA